MDINGYKIINDKFGIDKKYTFKIFKSIDMFNYFCVVINNKIYKTIDELADVLKVKKCFLIEEVKKLEKYDVTIYENKIILSTNAKKKFNEFAKKKFPEFTNCFYYECDIFDYYSLSFNNEQIYLRKIFDELEIDFEKYIKKVFSDNNLEKPSIVYFKQNVFFNCIRDFADFVILSGKDLFDKIEQWSIINKLKGEA